MESTRTNPPVRSAIVPTEDEGVRVTGLVEKPEAGRHRRRTRIGRYVLDPRVRGAAQDRPQRRGIQLTDALKCWPSAHRRRPVHAWCSPAAATTPATARLPAPIVRLAAERDEPRPDFPQLAGHVTSPRNDRLTTSDARASRTARRTSRRRRRPASGPYADGDRTHRGVPTDAERAERFPTGHGGPGPAADAGGSPRAPADGSVLPAARRGDHLGSVAGGPASSVDEVCGGRPGRARGDGDRPPGGGRSG